MAPILGRLSLEEWGLIIFVYTEKLLSFTISLILSVIPFDFFRKTKAEEKSDSSLDGLGENRSTREKKKHYLSSDNEISLDKRLYNCNSLKDMLFAIDQTIEMETHVVKTQDNYLLQIHRIPFNQKRLKGVSYKGAVYLQHGLLMCSNIWLCHSEDPMKNNLPLYLNALGFDVWMGNNRGNRYSSKNVNIERHTEKFWNFSLDEFAMYDIPDSLHYILNCISLENKNSKKSMGFFDTDQERISIVAFSQGSAQIFASLSLNPDLNNKVSSFIALSPALTPPGLFNKFVDSIIKLQPKLLFLFFGKKILLPTTSTLWLRILPTNLFNLAIKIATLFLFNWKNKNINSSQNVAFKNLYSPTSVKCIVHWFQILKTQKFQMFVSSNDINENKNSVFEPVPFPTKTNIQVPILLVYGDNDSLVDIDILKGNLPEKTTFELPISKHEHLDIIWGDNVNDLVFTKVADFLNFWRAKANGISGDNFNLVEAPHTDELLNDITKLVEVSPSNMSESTGAEEHFLTSSENNDFREELFRY
ncbi:hypothetical protein QEN19_002824 [Hanseniaspora menglaensis]